MIPKTRYARSGHVNIAYQEIGHGDVDIVFVPCWVSHLDQMWEEPRFARFLERLGGVARVIVFDKRGTGLSDPAAPGETLTLEQRMDDLLAVMDAAGSERAVLFGVSLGSPLCAMIAALHPERVARLVMFGGAAKRTWAPDYPWAPTAEQHQRGDARMEREWGGPVDLEAYAPSVAHDERFRAWWAAYLRQGASPAAAVAQSRMHAAIDVRPLLPLIQAPTLVLHRRDDRKIRLEEGRYLAERIPGATFVDLPGADHIPFVGDADAVIAQVAAFVAGKAPAPRADRHIRTVLVADLPGAIDAAARLGDRHWQGTRYAYLALLREELARYRGQVVTASLENVVATFDTPARAVRCADAIVQGGRRLSLRPRAGLHTGVVEISGTETGGAAVHYATRILAQARPGETLVSTTVRDLVTGSGLAFTPLSDADLHGLPEEWRLFRVGPDPAAQRTSPARATAEPPRAYAAAAPLSRREREVAMILARGLSNREIADELSIATATVERHVANILSKLGYRSRTQIAAWSAQQGLLQS